MNDRVTSQPIAEVIGYGLALLPPRILQRLEGTAWFTEDPVFAGLHPFGKVGDNAHDQTAKRNPHHVSGCLLERPADRRSTVVIPSVVCDGWTVTPHEVVHEAAHSLHESIGYWRGAPIEIMPVSEYAETNYWECFAEAFTLWACPPEVIARGWHPDKLDHYDRLYVDNAELVALFEELAR